MHIDSDKTARERIISEIDSNFFVEAGAGSGKTTSLVNRMAAMVEAGRDVSRICAITFTKAAAAEFYDRFQKELMKRNTPRCRQALENIDLCFMGTIDSFCNMVINEHPAEAGVPAAASVKEDGQLKASYAGEYTRILAGEYGSELQKKAVEFEGWHYSPAEKFADYMSSFMGIRNVEIACPDNDRSTRKSMEEDEKKIKQVISQLRNHPEWVHDTRASMGAWDVLDRRSGFLMGNWNGHYLDVMSALKAISDIRLIEEADMKELGPYGESVFMQEGKRVKTYNIDPDGPFRIVREMKDIQYRVTIDFIRSVMEPVAERLREKGVLGYFDYLLYLRNMLRRDAEGDGRLIAHIYRRHSYFLIDEFQDTNPMQAEIFFYLAAEKPVPDWTECVPRPGSLFIVGDPKQSIYRFRGADVGAFMRVRGLFDGVKGDVLQLSRNFRSGARLCGWFNQVFTDMMGKETDEQGRFYEIPLNEEASGSSSCSSLKSPEETAEKDSDEADCISGVFRYDTGDSDPEAIASIISNMVDNPAYSIDGRPVRYGDFMVITKAKAQIGPVIRSFMDLDVPYRVAGDVLFADCPALKGAAAAFKCAAVPSSREYAYEAREMGFDPEHLKDKGRGMTPAALLSSIIETEDIFGKFGTENIEYLYFAIEMLRESHACSMAEAAAYMSDMLQKKLDVERCINLDENDNRVYIANLHKVKGLEANIVILADAVSPRFNPEKRVNRGRCWVFSHGRYDIATDRYDDEKELEKVSQMAEHQRLIYVAATRAARMLLIADSGRKNYWQILNDSVSGKWTAKTALKQMLPPAEKNARAERRIIEASADNIEPTYRTSLPSQMESSYRLSHEEAAETKADGNDAALKGSMVHRLMEILVLSGGWKDSDDSLIKMVADEFDCDLSAALASIVRTIRCGGYEQEGNVPADILGEALSSDEYHCELPFCFRDDEGTVWNGIMDLAYRKGDKWYIVDYKTNADGSNLQERYREQLDAYAEALQTMTGCEAEAGIYHIDL